MSDRDPYDGQGGSYRIDPRTGRRELVERTRDEPAPPPPPAPDASTPKELTDAAAQA
ncbi:hypothetical protein [Pelomicrobium sp. G1]|uniref:hypothetical protein n=1 Tax=Pelomicrobium sp. G1 TaxID=3452920 RepID=UPI003F764E45